MAVRSKGVPFVPRNAMVVHVGNNLGIRPLVQTARTPLFRTVVASSVVTGVRPIVIGHAVIARERGGREVGLCQATKVGAAGLAQMLKEQKAGSLPKGGCFGQITLLGLADPTTVGRTGPPQSLEFSHIELGTPFNRFGGCDALRERSRAKGVFDLEFGQDLRRLEHGQIDGNLSPLRVVET
jgi:hypothetical protein